MNVLSLFDGMSCGQIALKKLGIKVDKYYASEIDKYAIEVTQANFPNTIQLGDVTKLDTSQLPHIDLIMGGSPCQGFSRANNNALAFDDPRSALFFEFVRCVNELKPKYFLLENVNMKKEWLDTITQYIGVDGIKINSSLVSAQNRVRWYWTNIPNIQQPEEKGIVLKDILENTSTVEEKKYYKPPKVGMNIEQVKVRKHKVDIPNLQHLLRVYKNNAKKTNKQIAEETNLPITKVEHWFRTDSSFAIPSDDVWLKLKKVLDITTDVFDKQIMEFEYRDGVYESKQRVYSDQGKSPTLTATNKEQMIETTTSDNGITNIKKGTSGKSWFFEQQTYSKDSKKTRSLKAGGGSGNIPKVIETKPKLVGRDNTKGHDILKRIYSEDGKSPTITAHAGKGTVPKVEIKPKQVGIAEDIKGFDAIKRVYSPQGKAPTLTTCGGGHREPKVAQADFVWRKLSPLECMRLQTVPDDYLMPVSNTRKYMLLGNGWTVDVICHILKNMDYKKGK